MILYCKSDCFDNTRKQTITIGNMYKVVAIYFNIGRGEMKFNIWDDHNRIAFYESDLFEITDNRIDDNWVLIKRENGYHMMMPTGMSYAGFWEDYHNDDQAAIKAFKDCFPEFNYI
jgi:hypothetical protein